jgi:hypothetical protein
MKEQGEIGKAKSVLGSPNSWYVSPEFARGHIQIEKKYMHRDVVVRIFGSRENEAPLASLVAVHSPHEIGVRRKHLRQLVPYATESGYLLVKDDKCSLAVAPRQVTQQLSNGLTELLPAAPNLAFSHESGTVIDLDTNVGLPAPPECLSSGIPLIMPIQMSKDDVTQFLLVMHGECSRSRLKGSAFVPDDTEDVLIVFVSDAMLRRFAGNGRQWPNQLAPNRHLV